tara:strand:+ start:217 stop:510 length:294 start_codon:yes stop_codon:yes gene_type:complete
METIKLTNWMIQDMMKITNEMERFGSSTIGSIQNRCSRKFDLAKEDVEHYTEILISLVFAEKITCQGGDGWNTSYSYQEIKLVMHPAEIIKSLYNYR